MKRHFARKTLCMQGHTHNSGQEAKRCDTLHVRQSKGEIIGLEVEPRFTFAINGAPVKMRNGQAARYTADFAYVEKGRKVVEDVKAKNGFVERDVPLRMAIAKHLWPDIDWRLV
jgi:hypothetical protein